MPRVFIVNEPLRKNTETGAYERYLPLDSLSSYGEIVELTAKGRMHGFNEACSAVRKGLKNLWRDGDYLVLVGDYALVAFAGFVLGEYTENGEKLRFLKWDRRKESYVPLIVRDAPGESA